MGALALDIDVRIRSALKGGRAVELSTLRLLKTELSQKRVEEKLASTADLSDNVVLDTMRGMVKKREKAIELFVQGQRPDLADIERAEIVVLEELLPKDLTDDELRGLVARTIQEVGAAGPRDMGKVMAALKGKEGVNPALASKLVKELLS